MIDRGTDQRTDHSAEGGEGRGGAGRWSLGGTVVECFLRSCLLCGLDSDGNLFLVCAVNE